MDVSVVIPTYNGAHVLPNQLEALAQQQTTLNYEVIISDNGSTDNLQAVIHNLSDAFPVPLRLIDSSDKQGVSHARNVGIKHAKAEIIAICDCDDFVSPTWVQAAWDGISTGADIIGGEIRISDFVKNQPENHNWLLSPESGIKKTTFGYGVTGCNFALRKSMAQALGGFDESLPPYGTEDSEFSFRASMQGYKFKAQPGLDIYFAPTKNPKILIKKVFKSGISQAVIWHHHDYYYGEHWKLKNSIAELVMWILNTPKHLRYLDRKKVFRGFIVRLGSLWGSILYTFKGWPEPVRFDFS